MLRDLKTVTRVSLLAAALAMAGCGAPAPMEEAEPSLGSAAEPQADELTEFCEEVGRRLSVADCEDYTRLAEQAEAGAAAFNAPDPMRRGETHMLQLAISFAPPEPEPPAPTVEPPAEAQAPSAAAGEVSPSPLDTGSGAAPAPSPATPVDVIEGLPGDTVQFTPLVGRFMRAELSGVGFEITPRSPASQEVTPDSVTTWTWEVVAEQGGVRSLTLTTIVEGCTADGECVPLRSTTQNYTVNVSVSPVDQAKDFLLGMPDWIKILTAIVAALAGLVAAVFSLRNAFKKKDA